MKTMITGTAAGLVLLLAAVTLPLGAGAQETEIQSLRGETAIDEDNAAPDIKRQAVDDRFARAYRQQPPLIPHKIDKYQVNLKVNQCLRCHDWPYNVDEGAPKVSETHYVDRNGVSLDKVTSSRWFCTQCHVPQFKARALVPNTFRSAFESD